MNIASKLLKKQKRQSLFLFLRGLVMLVMSIYVGIMLWTEGLGDMSESKSGRAALFVKIMKKIFGDRADLNQIMVNVMIGLMVFVALYSLYCLINGIAHINSRNTMLGKSILQQSDRAADFSETLASIDKELDQGVKTFGKVYIGREWILESQAMRLSRVQGVFCFDQGEGDFVLCCVDNARNIWTSSFQYEDDRSRAVKYLNSRFPEFVFGDKNAYNSFLEGE